MIDWYSFLNIEELTERKGHIKRVSQTMRGKRGIAGGDRETESERGEEVGERREREILAHWRCLWKEE